MSDSKDIKTLFLGMNYATASGRLKKNLMFHLIQKLGMDVCFRCGNKIETADELSIDHKKPWLHVDQKLFWDVNNIAFSHIGCNRVDRPYLGNGSGVICGSDELWCCKCKQCLPINDFRKKSGKRGARSHYRAYCKKCDNKTNRERRKRNGSSV